MRKYPWWWKSVGRALVVLLALGLAAGPWAARQAHAYAGVTPWQASQVDPQPTPVPTGLSDAPAADEAPSNAWILMLLLIVCSMGLLLVVGVGAAILMVRIRERL